MQYRLSDADLFLFNEGKLKEAYRHFGSHLEKDDKGKILGVRFTVYAPNAEIVSVVGDFNNWDSRAHVLEKTDDFGVFSLFVPAVSEWIRYKYCLLTKQNQTLFKADPFAFFADDRPETSSKVYDIDGFLWHDDDYLSKRRVKDHNQSPLAIYEVHLGSWMTKPDGSFHKYNELVDYLIPYVKEHGFTHIEIMPIIEHPLDESWGYQGTGYYAATSRYGVPKDFMYFVDRCHQEGLGVIVDWVPGHICKDAHGLHLFDGSTLYEYHDEKIRENKVWGTVNLDLGKGITKSYLLSNADFWIEYFHIDGFRIDAVSNILYYLGNSALGINEGAVTFLKALNYFIKDKDHSLLMFAEDSTTFPKLTFPVDEGGIGFDYKWNMGWMNDTLKYFEKDPIYRKYHHNLLTFGMVYNYSERFILPLSHDEVVHGKKSLVDKMPGDYWQKFANFRLLIGLLFTHPGKKLLFMGGEFAQMHEWKDKEELDWLLLNYPMHAQVNRFVKDTLKVYNYHRPLFELDYDPSGFFWIDADNGKQSILSFARKAKSDDELMVIVFNMTPVTYPKFILGVPKAGVYEEVLCSDKEIYGGSGQYNGIPLSSFPKTIHHQENAIELVVGPLSISILKYQVERS